MHNKSMKTKKNKQEVMENSTRGIIFLFLRYIIILVSSIGSLWVFYYVLTPLTINSVALLFKLLFTTIISQSSIFLNGTEIIINKACVAGSAFYLLFILTLSIPMNVKKRIKIILFSFVLLFILNILRIFVFGILYVNKFSLFDVTHKLVWYGLSSLFVFLIWILTIRIFHIKEIPVYDDFKFLRRLKIN